ncbi:MAG TPA: hypothetical protein IAC04_02955 [Candidatus Coprenecus stercoravium]|uniref:Fibronectin type-III domain-containing protein n=1 Tax=Candidatus Coprenecus stercoravium TaxID=2840735 RepID=A0A9D2K9P9_9BACT|nr:hypothetical protein [Candidatus Coprenecus stercoravium]
MKNSVLSLLTLLLAAAACSQDGPVDQPQRQQLQSPSPVVAAQDTTSFSLSWSPVDGAGSYDCLLSGQITSVADTVVNYQDLVPDSVYVVAVRAVPSDTNAFSASGWAEIEVRLDGAPQEDTVDNYIGKGQMFSVETENEESTRILHCYVIPEDKDMYYFRETFDDEYFAMLGGNALDVWTQALESYMAQFGSSAFDMVVSYGEDYWQVNYDYEEHLYIIVAGVDENLNRITDITMEAVYTGPVPKSDLTFNVDFRDVTPSGAVAYVEPSDKDETYSMILLEKDEIADYTSSELEDLIKYSYRDYFDESRIYSGDMTMTYREGTLTPATEYTLLIFGWNTLPSTEIFKYDFMTSGASSSEGLTFDFAVGNVAPYEMEVSIVPSRTDARYLCFPLPEEDYEEYKDDLVQYVYDVCDDPMNPLTVAQYLDMFGMIGTQDVLFDWFDHGIMPGVSYRLWAVGFDLEGEDVTFYEPVVYEDIITTPIEK